MKISQQRFHNIWSIILILLSIFEIGYNTDFGNKELITNALKSK